MREKNTRKENRAATKDATHATQSVPRLPLFESLSLLLSLPFFLAHYFLLFSSPPLSGRLQVKLITLMKESNGEVLLPLICSSGERTRQGTKTNAAEERRGVERERERERALSGVLSEVEETEER